uniref:Immunoglobulin V-set domain-containing protein n=1 Tax=Chelydra serpentina TaxID=8475 RepID=A0A8C3RPH8_CHESE
APTLTSYSYLPILMLRPLYSQPVESTVPRGPSILNGAEGSFVSAKCHYDPQRNYEMKYWCSWKEAGCSLVADTNGFVQDAFEGRIQIISDNQKNGTFTVVMSHLEEKDAGWYWCGGLCPLGLIPPSFSLSFILVYHSLCVPPRHR